MTRQEWERIKEYGRQAGAAGKAASANPYATKHTMRDQSEAWEIGREEGAMQRKAEARR